MLTMNEYDSAAGDIAALVLLMGVFAVIAFFAVIVYVISAIMLQAVFKRAGHKYPYAAWVPVWNTATLLQVGGIKQAWIWTLVIYLGASILNLIPFVGSILVLGLAVITCILYYYAFRNLQKSFGVGSTTSAVLGIFFTLIYYIWLFVVTKNKTFDLDALKANAETVPLNWFGDDDVLAHFPLAANHSSNAAFAPPTSNIPTPPPAPQGPTVAPDSSTSTLDELLKPPSAPVWPDKDENKS